MEVGVHRQKSEDLQGATHAGGGGYGKTFAAFWGNIARQQYVARARHEQIVEVTVQARLQTIAAAGEGSHPDAALREAIDQNREPGAPVRGSALEGKRLPKRGKDACSPPPCREPRARPAAARDEGVGKAGRTKTKDVDRVHRFPSRHCGETQHLESQRSDVMTP